MWQDGSTLVIPGCTPQLLLISTSPPGSCIKSMSVTWSLASNSGPGPATLLCPPVLIGLCSEEVEHTELQKGPRRTECKGLPHVLQDAAEGSEG